MKKIIITLICISLSFQVVQGFKNTQSSHFTDENTTFDSIVVSEKWSFETNNTIGTAPMPFDLEGDGTPEIIFGSQNGCIYCVNSTGSELWSYCVGDVISSTPACGDLNGDGYLEIVFGSFDENVYCITPLKNGTEIIVYKNWQFSTSGDVSTCPTIVDIDDDDELEILIGSGDSKLYCINSTGALEWDYETGGPFYFESALGVGDLDQDGDLEILAGTDTLYCIDNDGSLVWKSTEILGVGYSSPTIRDFYGGMTPNIIVGSTDNTIYCLDSTGEIEWEYETGGDIYSSAAIGNLGFDSEFEYVIGSNDGNVYCFFGNGTLHWSFATGDEVWSTPSIADLDGDGIYEVLVGSNDNHFYCITNNGEQIWNYTIQGAARTPSLVIDLDSDGIFEIVFGSDFLDGKLYCLELSGISQSGRANWYCFRSSFQNVGAVDYDSDLLDHQSEIYYGTDFGKNDTDSDGWYDGIEILAGTDPLSDSDFPPRDFGAFTPPPPDTSTETPTSPYESIYVPGFVTEIAITTLIIFSTITYVYKKKQKRNR